MDALSTRLSTFMRVEIWSCRHLMQYKHCPWNSTLTNRRVSLQEFGKQLILDSFIDVYLFENIHNVDFCDCPESFYVERLYGLDKTVLIFKNKQNLYKSTEVQPHKWASSDAPEYSLLSLYTKKIVYEINLSKKKTSSLRMRWNNIYAHIRHKSIPNDRIC